MVFEDGDGGMTFDRGNEGFFDFQTREVMSVQDAALGVPALAPQIEFRAALGFFPQVEGHAEFDQLLDAVGTLADDKIDHILVAQARARLEGILDVQLERIFRTGHTGHAALGPCGVGRGFGPLGHHGHRAMGGGLEGVGQAGDARAKDDVVKFLHAAPRGARCR